MSDGPTLAASPLRPLPRPTRADASAPQPPTLAWIYPYTAVGPCEQALDARPAAPSSPLPRLIFTRGRRRTVDTQPQFCPAPDGADHGGQR